MKYLISVALFLSVWGVARPAAQRAVYAPNSSPSTQQPTNPDPTQTSVAHPHDRLLEGCIAGSRDNLALTDAAGKVYQLRGDTATLGDHIGQQATIIGTETPPSGPAALEARHSFTVKKVKMIASICSPFK